MPNTTRYAIPYPANTDYVTNGASAMGSLAGSVDALLGSEQFMGGFRNKLINGDFTINQRGTAAVSASNLYPTDRWRIFFNGGTYSAQTIGSNPFASGMPFKWYTRHIVAGGAAAGNYSIFQQQIEGVETLAGKVPTVSFWARVTSGTAKIGASLDQDMGTGGSPSAGVNGVGASVTVTTTWARYTITLPQLAAVTGKTFGSNGNDCLILRLWLSGHADYDSRSGTVGVQSKTFEIAGVQVEQGLYSTEFENRPRQVELALCERYYKRISAVGASGVIARLAPVGYQGSTTTSIFSVQPGIPMRAAPTVGGAGAEVSDDFTFASAISTLSVSQANGSTWNLTATHAAVGAQFRPIIIRASNNNTAYVDYSAEL